MIVERNIQLKCNQWIYKLNLTLGNYNLTDEFFVIDVPDTNVVLGVEWLFSIGEYGTNYQTMEIGFQWSATFQTKRLLMVCVSILLTFRHCYRSINRYLEIFPQVDLLTEDLSM